MELYGGLPGGVSCCVLKTFPEREVALHTMFFLPKAPLIGLYVLTWSKLHLHEKRTILSDGCQHHRLLDCCPQSSTSLDTVRRWLSELPELGERIGWRVVC